MRQCPYQTRNFLYERMSFTGPQPCNVRVDVRIIRVDHSTVDVDADFVHDINENLNTF